MFIINILNFLYISPLHISIFFQYYKKNKITNNKIKLLFFILTDLINKKIIKNGSMYEYKKY